MLFPIFDYKRSKTEVEIGDINTIISIDIRVITGDEYLTVYYIDGTSQSFDSCADRRLHFNDKHYIVFDFNKNINLLTNPSFAERNNSYWYFDYDGEIEDYDYN